MDGTQYSNEILLTQLVNVITHNELQAPEPSCHHLLLIILGGLADGDDEDAPTIILDLHAASLDDLLDAL